MNYEKNLDGNLQLSKLKGYLNDNPRKRIGLSQLKFFLPYMKKQLSLIIVVAVSAIFSSIIILPVPVISKFVIDKYVVEKDTKMVFIMCMVILGLYLLLILSKIILNYSYSVLNSKLLLSIKKDLTNRIIDLPLSFFAKVQSGYLISRINEIDKLGSVFSVIFIQLIVSSITFLFSIAILGLLEWEILLLVLALLPIQFLIMKKSTGSIQNVSKKMMEDSANINKEMQEVISGINTIKSFSTEKKEKNKINSSINSFYSSMSVHNIFIGISQDIIGFIVNFSNLMLLLVSCLLIIKQEFTLGMYIASIQYASYIFKPIQSFTSAGILIQPSIVAIDRINEYFLLFGDKDNHQRRKSPAYFHGKIIFQNVSFFYDQEKQILNDISFEIEEGQKIILAGDNGSGKTTVTKLLLQLYMPSSGNIYIDDLDIKDIKLDVLRSKIGIVSQDVFLFNDTVKNNLIYGCNENDYKEDELELLVNKFCDFVNTFPDGLNTIIGENGICLSGGQKQAISIIRTILKHPDILIWDEGNVFLDANSKHIIKKLIDIYFTNKTCIFITHDTHLFDNIDKILLIKENGIVYVK